MHLDDKRIRVITGHYGSGKTEFAVNYAVQLSRMGKKTALCDLDIVNPYFRSREQEQRLNQEGVEVIYSSLRGGNIDIPAVSARITGPLVDKTYDYIIDLGGNDVGVIAMNRFHPFFDWAEIDFFMIVNVFRPDTADAEGILSQMSQIERAAGAKITGLINNSNLVRETTWDCLFRGDQILRQVTKETGVPVRYTSYVEELLAREPVPEGKPPLAGGRFPMRYFMREAWM
jgi:hypothetical protein